ncbi:hypothetical protein V6x_00540 [Gimesia chilikensis]|uniref:Uncharacterized protein n=1 Tax=Gimesia chilikensis TaxID=2605989 RepID=A0A517W561_9PLAN|nr:hypothetical protein V6x_00540 [Gimesia chilikensis]
MWTPEVDHPYIFVRRNNEVLEETIFTMHSDGSCGFEVESRETGEGTFMAHIYEFNPDAWKNALKDLEKLGFIELGQAVSQKVLPADWKPSQKIQDQLEALEARLSPQETPKWISKTGEIDEWGLYRELKKRGMKEQQIYKLMKDKCAIDYKRFKTIVRAEENEE